MLFVQDVWRLQMHQVKTNAFLHADVRMGFFRLESGVNFR